MKIAILGPFYPYRGGIAQLDTSLYNELEAKGYDVKAFSFTTLYPQFLFPGKTQFVEDQASIADQSKSIRILSTVNPITYRITADAINQYNPDVLIVPYWMSFFAPIFGIVAMSLRQSIKIVALVHNALPHEKRFFDKAFAKFFFKKCDAFIVMSDYVESDLLSLIPNAKILNNEHPIYDQFTITTTRDEACVKLEIDSSKNNILFFGLIRDYKGLDLLIEAMDYLDDSYQLIIAGESYVDFSRYQTLIDQSKGKDRIKVFQQYIPEEEVATFFTAADVLVLPYRSATQSGVLAVAYQLEKPIVSTNVGALGTMIRRADTGVVVDEISSKSIAKGIESYFNDQEKERLVNNIRAEKRRLSWSSFTERLVSFFKNDVLKQG